MHDTSKFLMKWMVEGTRKYVPGSTTVYDIGSFDVNGNYRDLILSNGFNYLGIDITFGPNVDCIWDGKSPLEPTHLIVSGSCIEHVRDPFEWVRILYDSLHPGGHLLITTHAQWKQHRYPVDCFRFYPDGMQAMAEKAGFACTSGTMKSKTAENPNGLDCWAIMRRPS